MPQRKPQCGNGLLTSQAVDKRRFSEFTVEPSANQEYVGGLKQSLDDEAEAVVAECQAPVLQQPGEAALDRPAPLSRA